MPLPRLRTAAGTLAALLVLCAPAAATAPVSIAPLKRCYVSVAKGYGEPVILAAAGFAAGAPVDVRLDGETVATITAGADGRIDARVYPPHQQRGQRAFRIQMVQRDDPGHRVELTSRVSALAVNLRPRAARPRARVTWTGRGFTAAGPLHVHYVKNGRLRRTVRIARPRGACGVFRIRRAQFPFPPALGRWVLQVDQQRAFAPMPGTPFVQLPVTVRRVTR